MKNFFLKKPFFIQKEQLRLRYAITKAIEHRKKESVPDSEKVKLLKMDIENSISHVFGEHKFCAKLNYFCQEQYKPSDSILSDLKKTGIIFILKRGIDIGSN